MSPSPRSMPAALNCWYKWWTHSCKAAAWWRLPATVTPTCSPAISRRDLSSYGTDMNRLPISHAILAAIRRDLLAALRKPGQILNPLLFYILAVSLFPLGVGPERELLQSIASGVVWVAALLSVLLALESLFRADFEEGGLELLALSPVPLPLLALAKILAHWLLTGLPLIVLSPLLGMLLALPETAV